MRPTILLALMILPGACAKDATGPKLHDPFVAVRIVNDLDTSYALYVRFPGNPVAAFAGVVDLGNTPYRCESFGSIADTTRLYLTAFRSNPAVSSGDFSAGDSTKMRTTGLVNPFVGQPGHGDVAVDPIRWLWRLSTDSLMPDTVATCNY